MYFFSCKILIIYLTILIISGTDENHEGRASRSGRSQEWGQTDWSEWGQRWRQKSWRSCLHDQSKCTRQLSHICGWSSCWRRVSIFLFAQCMIYMPLSIFWIGDFILKIDRSTSNRWASIELKSNNLLHCLLGSSNGVILHFEFRTKKQSK